MILDYIVVEYNNVKSYLNQGWELYGDPMLIGNTVNQAMVLREKKLAKK